MYDPNRLLDTLLKEFKLQSDKALARQLGITSGVIAGLRSGTIPVTAWMLGWIAEYSGRNVEEVRRLLGDRRLKARLDFPVRKNSMVGKN